MEVSNQLDMKNVFIVAPTTPKSRIPVISNAASVSFTMCQEKVSPEKEMILQGI